MPSLIFMINRKKVHEIIDKIMHLTMLFVEKQIQAGAHCIGIGDAACSQCSLEFYRKFAFDWEKKLVDHIHHLGAIPSTAYLRQYHSHFTGYDCHWR